MKDKEFQEILRAWNHVFDAVMKMDEKIDEIVDRDNDYDEDEEDYDEE